MNVNRKSHETTDLPQQKMIDGRVKNWPGAISAISWSTHSRLLPQVPLNVSGRLAAHLAATDHAGQKLGGKNQPWDTSRAPPRTNQPDSRWRFSPWMTWRKLLVVANPGPPNNPSAWRSTGIPTFRLEASSACRNSIRFAPMGVFPTKKTPSARSWRRCWRNSCPAAVLLTPGPRPSISHAAGPAGVSPPGCDSSFAGMVPVTGGPGGRQLGSEIRGMVGLSQRGRELGHRQPVHRWWVHTVRRFLAGPFSLEPSSALCCARRQAQVFRRSRPLPRSRRGISSSITISSKMPCRPR